MLLEACEAYIGAELLKREGQLKAATAENRFAALAHRIDEIQQAVQVLKTGSKKPPGTLASGEDAVVVCGGYEECADRLIFPYGKHFESFADSHQVRHMTILADGVVENPEKVLYLGGKFNINDSADLKSQSTKKLKEELEERLGAGATKEWVQRHGDSQDSLIQGLMGQERDVKLPERALLSFPQLHTMPYDKASSHVKVFPNSNFVYKRDNGTYGVAHCWPVKFNDTFRSNFKLSRTNPNPSRFSPRAASEFSRCLARIFPSESLNRKGGGLLSKLCCATKAESGAFSVGSCDILYASSSRWNSMPVLIGTTAQLIAYLRVRPALRERLQIVKLLPTGFATRVVVPKKGPEKFKYFTLQPRGKQVIYMKQGYETMASCKPYDLFLVDCVMGAQYGPETEKPAEGLAVGDQTSSVCLKEYEKDEAEGSMKGVAHTQSDASGRSVYVPATTEPRRSLPASTGSVSA